MTKRQAGNLDNYQIDEKALYWCKTCDGPVMTAAVYHPIWDGIFPCSGGGEVRCNYEPYCPNCEIKPDAHGWPVDYSPRSRAADRRGK